MFNLFNRKKKRIEAEKKRKIEEVKKRKNLSRNRSRREDDDMFETVVTAAVIADALIDYDEPTEDRNYQQNAPSSFNSDSDSGSDSNYSSGSDD